MRDAEKYIAQIRADMDALDRTMRLFDPAASPLASAPVRPAVRNGEVSRAVLTVLREAPAPVSARDIATKIAADRGVDVSTSAAMQAHCGRVRSALDRKRDGVVREQRGDPIVWRVEYARRESCGGGRRSEREYGDRRSRLTLLVSQAAHENVIMGIIGFDSVT